MLSHAAGMGAVLCLAAGLLACGDPTGAGGLRFVLPKLDQSLDPEQLEPSNVDISYDRTCGWRTEVPDPDDQLLMDVHFHLDQFIHRHDRPLSIHRWLVESAGGQIVYQYHLPVFRILIKARDVPQLAQTWGDEQSSSMEIIKVPNFARFDWNVFVRYHLDNPISAEDEARILALGGRIESRYTFINTLYVTLPDRSISVLRARPEVEHVTAPFNWVIC